MSKSNTERDLSTRFRNLPNELHHEEVVDYRDRCEPRLDCYQIVLDTEKMPVMYRSQWNDDWEVLGAAIEEDDGEAKLRVTIIERVESDAWFPYAIALGGATATLSYMEVGDFLLQSGRMGEFAHSIGTAIAWFCLAVVFVYLAATLVQDYRGTLGGVRP